MDVIAPIGLVLAVLAGLGYAFYRMISTADNENRKRYLEEAYALAEKCGRASIYYDNFNIIVYWDIVEGDTYNTTSTHIEYIEEFGKEGMRPGREKSRSEVSSHYFIARSRKNYRSVIWVQKDGTLTSRSSQHSLPYSNWSDNEAAVRSFINTIKHPYHGVNS